MRLKYGEVGHGSLVISDKGTEKKMFKIDLFLTKSKVTVVKSICFSKI